MEGMSIPRGDSYNIPITPELRKRVRDYHLGMGDRSAYIVRVVRDENGYPYILVRVTDAQKNKVSCIEAVYDDYVTEITHDDRENEADMVFCFGCDDCTDESDNEDWYGWRNDDAHEI